MFSTITGSTSKALAISSLALAGFVGCTQTPRNPPPDASAPPPAAASGQLNPQPLPPANQRVSPQPPPPPR